MTKAVCLKYEITKSIFMYFVPISTLTFSTGMGHSSTVLRTSGFLCRRVVHSLEVLCLKSAKNRFKSYKKINKK